MLIPGPVRLKIAPEGASKPGGQTRRRRKRNAGSSPIDRASSFFSFTRNPRYLAGLVVLFIVMGAMLVSRTSQHQEVTLRQFPPDQHAVYDLTQLRIALEIFRKDCGRYPSTRETLLPLLRPSRAPGWDGPYIKTLLPDPWQTPYRYSVSNGVVRLTSDGPDKKPGTSDDIEAPVPNLDELFPRKATNAPSGSQHIDW